MNNVRFLSRYQIITSVGDRPVQLRRWASAVAETGQCSCGWGVNSLSGCQHDGTMHAAPKSTFVLS